MSVPDTNAVVVVFHMKGCPACEEHVPRFEAVAQQVAGPVPFYVLDVAKESKAADYYGVKNVPVTMVLRRPVGAVRMEGALSEGQIVELFDIAKREIARR